MAIRPMPRWPSSGRMRCPHCARTGRARSTSTRTVGGGRCTPPGVSLSPMAWVRRAGILLTVLVVALGLGGAAAGAKKKHKKKGEAWASQVTLGHPATTQFNGAVDSKLDACRSSRVVTLFYTDPNNGLTSLLSVQRTDGRAKYQVVLPKDAFA